MSWSLVSRRVKPVLFEPVLFAFFFIVRRSCGTWEARSTFRSHIYLPSSWGFKLSAPRYGCVEFEPTKALQPSFERYAVEQTLEADVSQPAAMADDSVHALLADEELVDCTLLIDGEGMGHLLGDDKAGDLAKGAQLKLALWLALVLAKKNMVRISLPNRYGASVRADLEAGPTVVDLHSIAPYYYTVGHKLADATGEDSLRKELRAAISGDRFEKAFDWSQVSLDRDVSELRETLAREEQELFDAGYRAARDVRAWKRRRTARLTTSAIYKRAAPERVG